MTALARGELPLSPAVPPIVDDDGDSAEFISHPLAQRRIAKGGENHVATA